MAPWIQLLLTILCALAVGYLLDRIHLPGGMMIGAVIGSCLLGVLTGQANMPGPAKTIAQIIAGAYIGSGITRDDVRQMKTVVKPALILIPCLLVINIIAGLLVYHVSELDMMTALMCCVPGGISDIPMIAADLGADPSVVVTMQFIRLVLGIGCFPLMIRAVTGKDDAGRNEVVKTKKKKDIQVKYVVLTFSVAAVCGLIGKVSPMPSGTMGFATLGSIAFACAFPGKAQMPRLMRKGAQLLSGAYVGASIGAAQLKMLTTLGFPVVILISGYTLGCFAIGFLLFRAGCFSRREGMLAATPAGASDMALISADLGVSNVKLIVLQVLRLIVVVLVFPSILSFVVHLFA
ncbi:MAG: AbrB family transcriptional regulator [Clostridia bacterium]|nr:AbrB family transcriptional regulator [Clostridia bacterium]